MGLTQQYQDLHSKYAALAKKSADGDLTARKEKAKVFQDVRSMEREAARDGYVLAGGKDQTKAATGREQVATKRSLQEEYVRKFESPDGKDPEVVLNGEKITLARHHRKRLLGK